MYVVVHIAVHLLTTVSSVQNVHKTFTKRSQNVHKTQGPFGKNSEGFGKSFFYSARLKTIPSDLSV